MARRRGSPRKLTDDQIRQVLAWHTRWQAFRTAHGTALELAARLRVNVHVIRYCMAQYRKRRTQPRLAADTSVARRGRPRRLSAVNSRRVIAWYCQYQRFLAVQGSVRTLATKLDVSVTTIYDCIRREGHYFQRSRAAMTVRTASASLSRQRRRTRTGGRASASACETELRSRLLKNWRRAAPIVMANCH
jgi:transposase